MPSLVSISKLNWRENLPPAFPPVDFFASLLVHSVVAGAIAGVDHFHQHGIDHNALKPANILLFPDNYGTGGTTGKLINFGLALGEREICFCRGAKA